MRKLASIQQISKIEPIVGADRIELATVLGWHVVVGKGQFKEGERVIYLEVDSILPEWLMTKIDFTDSRLKTRRFRGVYSQGLCIKIDDELACIMENVPLTDQMDAVFQTGRYDGDDVTDVLGIKKYEPDERNGEKWYVIKESAPKKWYMKFKVGRWFWKKFLYKPVRKDFPSWIPKTDETRIQVLQDILDEYKGTACEYTEKLDGSSITFWLEKKCSLFGSKKILHVCSRNKEILDTKDFMYETAAKLIPNLEKLPEGAVVQGEILGPNIQKNKYRLKDFEIYLYQIRINGEYINPVDFRWMAAKAGFKTVPFLGISNLSRDIDYYIDLSIGQSKLCPDTAREGIVIRPLDNIRINDNRFVDGRISFKAINPKFLVKYDL